MSDEPKGFGDHKSPSINDFLPDREHYRKTRDWRIKKVNPRYNARIIAKKNQIVRLKREELEDLIIKLDSDGIINFSIFMQMCIEAYLEDDLDFTKCLAKMKHRYMIRNKKSNLDVVKLVEHGKQKMKNYKLSQEEIENIYDLLDNDEDDRWYDNEETLDRDEVYR